MDTKVGSQIAPLLYQHDTVILPQVGAIESAYQSATIDNVQGTVYPPSRALSFNRHLQIDDGVLLQAVQEAYATNYEVARQLVEAFSDEIRQELAQRRPVNLPAVGRLFADLSGQHQFIPEQTNFNPDAFGLPAVKFYPVLRNRQAAASAALAPRSAATTRPAPVSRRVQLTRRLNAALPYVLAAAFVGIVSSVVLLQSNTAADQAGAARAQTIANRINQKPGLADESTYVLPSEAAEDAAISTPVLVDDIPVAPAAPATPVAGEVTPLEETPISDLDTDRTTLPPGTRVDVAVVGAFGSSANVRKMVEKIYAAGYEAYTEKSGKLTKVGIEFAYSNRDERFEMLQAVQAEFNPSAYLLRFGK